MYVFSVIWKLCTALCIITVKYHLIHHVTTFWLVQNHNKKPTVAFRFLLFYDYNTPAVFIVPLNVNSFIMY